MSKNNFLSILIVFAFLITGCHSKGPEPIEFGKDQCVYCKMTISDAKYGAELITNKGLVNKFDAIECMVNFIQHEQPEYKKLYAVAHNKPRKLHPVDSLQFIISLDFRSPMGANLVAFHHPSFREKKYNMLSWHEVMQKNFNMGHQH
ncbi:MAG: copper-binding protein [Bacteroidetes bacterium]|jgi:copper chaperone NosL|nr:copper-binding protein [Bacteroidota bacterium]